MFEFMAIDFAGSDVAFRKTATQSTTFKNSSKFSAAQAVDGAMGTFCHTDLADYSASWTVDLGSSGFKINSVSVFNRYCIDAQDAPMCLCRLTNATVELLNHTNDVVGSANFGNTCGDLNPVIDFSPCVVSDVLRAIDCQFSL